MSLLIKNLDMPQEKKITLTIFPDGRVYENHGERLWGHGKDCIPWKAVPIPPHGRLTDVSALIDAIIVKYMRHERNRELVFSVAEIKQDLADIINEQPTILEAEEGE